MAMRPVSSTAYRDWQRRLKIGRLLRHALTSAELRLVYQPVVDSASRKTVGVEALLRWTNRELGEVPPAEFIPVAEEAGLMGRIGEWLLEQACAQAARWRRIMPHLVMSVNISPVQVDERLPRHVRTCLERNGLDASALLLEFTEGTILRDNAVVSAAMAELSRLGVKLAIDDFGTGYASLVCLKRLPVHTLKIDRSFVAGLPRDLDSLAIVHAIVRMAHSLGLTATAEGVETCEQAAILRELRCDMLQGYLFGRPASPAELAATLPYSAHWGEGWRATNREDTMFDAELAAALLNRWTAQAGYESHQACLDLLHEGNMQFTHELGYLDGPDADAAACRTESLFFDDGSRALRVSTPERESGWTCWAAFRPLQ
jgi:diguanylate cyclase